MPDIASLPERALQPVANLRGTFCFVQTRRHPDRIQIVGHQLNSCLNRGQTRKTGNAPGARAVTRRKEAPAVQHLHGKGCVMFNIIRQTSFLSGQSP
ncbi:MAG: hypothetical protein IKO72_13660 [Kiritimatiellae bacterium]|nr:hypothetical protein [Kiritimatiellia bacterium]